MAASVCLFLVPLLSVAGVLSENHLPEYPHPSWARPVYRSLQKSFKLGDTTFCNNSLYDCIDCTNAAVCKPTASGPKQVNSVECPKERPWCVAGSCVTTQPQRCGKTEEFNCMKETGVFLDNKCTMFHICENYVSRAFECAVPGQTYNPLTHTCDTTTSCGSFSCDGKKGMKVPHNIFPSFFAYCHEENSISVIDRCNGTYELNPDTQTCEAICRTAGIIPNEDDCHKFFRCNSKTFLRTKFWEKEEVSCPSNTFYSRNDFMCVTESTTEKCTKAI